MAKRKRRTSGRKTYKKSTAKNKAHGRPVYKVKGGWRIGKRR